MAGESAAQQDEQDFSIPGQDEADQGGIASGGSVANVQPSGAPQTSPTPQSPAAGAGNAGNDPYFNDPNRAASDINDMPKASGRALILGNLLRSILGGVMTGVGNSNPARARGFQAATQANQLAQQNQRENMRAMNEADQMRAQTTLTSMRALQYEYLLKRMPQEEAQKHLDAISAFKQNLIKEGASVEAEGDDEKASDAQAFHLNGTDSRATNHAGRFYSLPTMDPDGKAKWDVVFVPTKDVLQNDFKYKDAEGNDQTIEAGTPMSGAMGKFVENMNKNAQDQHKADHKMMSDALKPNVPDTEIPQTVGWLANQQKQKTPLYQQNKNAVDAQINTLSAARKQIQSDKLAQAHAGRVDAADLKEQAKEKGANAAINYATSYLNETPTGPGDEALLEKFFELAKPSTGFRMTQPQQDMLRNAQSWLNSADAKARHATEGTYFSPTQRKQIVGTMNDLARANGLKSAGGGMPDLGKPVYVNGKLVGHTKDGKTMTPVQ